ncbi:hypothetical protein EsDP_00003422 [Epichloe bromicola]|uniref:Microbial-type PARG catalytic domain-containing protein n=1 Tax=Epichloe bromicola TaxID=79588 RepID=A0ABQ0CNQ8_9HYPO
MAPGLGDNHVRFSASGRAAVLNMASHVSPGGGWLKGARAQGEALCYRSSLALSLHRRYYPFKQRMGLYTPDVVVIRSDMPSGHKLLVPDILEQDLPVGSVLSIAALRCPETRGIHGNTADGVVLEKPVYAHHSARELTKDKIDSVYEWRLAETMASLYLEPWGGVHLGIRKKRLHIVG